MAEPLVIELRSFGGELAGYRAGAAELLRTPAETDRELLARAVAQSRPAPWGGVVVEEIRSGGAQAKELSERCQS